MSEGSRPLPDYENPPVAEVVCGVQFQPLEKLRSPYIGLIWQRYRAEYPDFQEQPELVHLVEPPEQLAAPRKTFEVRMLQTPLVPRVLFVHRDDTRVIQVQQDRFIYNWRKRPPDDDYPRYGAVFGAFLENWATFLDVVSTEGLGEVVIDQYEMTYLNHIWQGEGWDTLGDMAKVFPDLSWRSAGGRFLPLPVNMSHRASFPLPGGNGRLHLSISTALSTEEGKRLVSMDLTARGFPGSPGDEAMRNWFNLAHEWIVRGFADLTSDEIQKSCWRRLR